MVQMEKKNEQEDLENIFSIVFGVIISGISH